MRNFTLLIFTLLSQFLFCQEKPDFRPPMDIPLILSGNFGELRSDHFHSGVDIKTQGVSGQQVFAIESGYVSRIKVQGGGYGKALYIDHPGGYTSVYGHLSEYSPKIDSLVNDLQYQLESFELDKYFKAGEIEISKGELIALSGNSGSSAGPHLHFEIRRKSDQVPLNVLHYNFPVIDDVPPQFKRLLIYPLDENSQVNNGTSPFQLQLTQKNDTISLNTTDKIKAYGNIGIGVEVYDYLNHSKNRCGIYSLELIVDGQPFFASEMNEFSFAESRFINAHIDYARKIEENLNIQRLYKLPYNNLSIYKYLENDGKLNIRDSLLHKIEIRTRDTYGNATILTFFIQGMPRPEMMLVKNKYKGIVLPYNAQSGFEDKNIRLSFPAYCFYENVKFSFARTKGRDDLLSDVFHIHTSATPVHKAFQIYLTPNNLPDKHLEKLCLVSVEDDILAYAGGTYNGRSVTGELRSFGNYAIAIDTIAPEIRALNMHSGKDMTASPGIRFTIDDKLSGIDAYNGYIDNQWVLFEYDPKNKLLFYEFDSRVPISKKNHELEIYLSDALGNKSVYHTVFYR